MQVTWNEVSKFIKDGQHFLFFDWMKGVNKNKEGIWHSQI